MKEWKPLTKRCSACGIRFVQQKPRQRTCGKCGIYASYSLAAKKKLPKSTLDMNIEAAEAAGMSYGKYKASQVVQTWTLRGKIVIFRKGGDKYGN